MHQKESELQEQARLLRDIQRQLSDAHELIEQLRKRLSFHEEELREKEKEVEVQVIDHRFCQSSLNSLSTLRIYVADCEMLSMTLIVWKGAFVSLSSNFGNKETKMSTYAACSRTGKMK